MSQLLVEFVDDHSTELLAALGNLVAAYGDLEQVLWLTPKRIRNLTLAEWKKTLADPEVERLKKVSERVKSIRRTYREHLGVASVPADLSELLREAKKVDNERHDMIHALWVRDMQGNVVRIRLGKRRPADVATVSNLVARVRGVRDRINEYPWTQPSRSRERKRGGSQMTGIKVAVLGLCISVTASAAATAQDMLLWTPSVSKCSDYLKADKRIQLEMTGWVLGYIAGTNATSNDAWALEAAPLNSEVDWAMLWKHCHEHPRDTIVQVAVAMEGEFSPKR